MEPLDAIFYPKSLAIVGASATPGAIGNLVLNNVINDGFAGKIYPINPKAAEVLGMKTYPSVSSVPDKIDMAVLIIPSKIVPAVMEECAQKGAKGLVIISAGFSEAGPEGKALEKRVLEIAAGRGMRIIGPNCLGIVSTSVKLNASFGMSIKGSGPISFVSQSGAFADGVLGWAQDLGIGFDKFVSIGNKSDVDDADLIEYFAKDDKTKSIALYIEGIKDGAKFFKAARKFSKLKPVVALKSGRSSSGSRAALSHTGSLAGSDAIYDAAFRQGGVIRAKTVEDLFDMAKALAYQKPAAGKRIVILTNAGGLGVMAADTCEELGLSVGAPSEKTKQLLRQNMPAFGSAANPVDFTAQGTPREQTDMYKKNFEILVKSGEYDGIIVLVEGNYPMEFVEMFTKEFPEHYKALNVKVPVVIGWMASNVIDPYFRKIEESGLPVYSISERAVKGMQALVEYGEIKRRL